MIGVAERISTAASDALPRVPRWAVVAPCALLVGLSAWWAMRGGVAYGRRVAPPPASYGDALDGRAVNADDTEPAERVPTASMGQGFVPGAGAGTIPGAGAGVEWWCDLFPEPPAPEPPPAPPPKLEVELIAIFARDGVRVAFVHALRSNEYATLAAGDALPGAGPGARIVEVLPDAVIVEVAGARRRLELNP